LFRRDWEEFPLREGILVAKGVLEKGGAGTEDTRRATFRSRLAALATAFLTPLNLASLARADAERAALYFSIQSCSVLLKPIILKGGQAND
jgi:hypothetical protein